MSRRLVRSDALDERTITRQEMLAAAMHHPYIVLNHARDRQRELIAQVERRSGAIAAIRHRMGVVAWVQRPPDRDHEV